MSADESRLELAAEGLSFPTSLTFDEQGTAYVAESGLPFGGARAGGRILRLGSNGAHQVLAEDLRPPVNGLTYHNGFLYVSEGGHPARISRFDLDGKQTVLLDNLPGPGNYHTNMVAFGPDGKMYFSQGAMTNSGIVGLDAYELGWLRRLPHAHDIPGYDITLAGVSVETENPLTDEPNARVRTGAFSQFGSVLPAGERIQGQVPCTSAILRCNHDGGELELVAWGLRNAFGLGFLPDGRLFTTDQGADDRGSRPVGDVPDMLFEVKQGAWYGYPDFIGGDPITKEQFRPTRGPAPTFLLANHDELPQPERPLLRFPSHAAAVKFDVAPAGGAFGGQIFVALFGDEAPMTAPEGPQVGRAIGRIDPADWSLHQVIGAPFARPIDLRFERGGTAMQILDFGSFEMTAERGVAAVAGSGKVWRLPLASVDA